MAQEVHLSSLQELEREVILQVLYRDQMVQNVEEERIRYVVAAMGGILRVLAFPAWGLDYWGAVACSLLSILCDKSPNDGCRWRVTPAA